MQADPSLTGNDLFVRAWGKVVNTSQAVRVASFNVGSGAFLSFQSIGTSTVMSGATYEIHQKLDPADKDRCLDATIRQVRIREEWPFWSVEQKAFYAISDNILDICNAFYLSNPNDSLNQGKGHFTDWKLTNTGSGQMLRIHPSLPASYQIILDAIRTASLGATDTASIDLVSDDWVLAGAAARAYRMLRQSAPGKEEGVYRERQREYAAEFSRLSAHYQPLIDRPLELDNPPYDVEGY